MTVSKRATKAAIQESNTLSYLITRRLKTLICLHGKQSPSLRAPEHLIRIIKHLFALNTLLAVLPSGTKVYTQQLIHRHGELLSQSRLCKIQQHLGTFCSSENRSSATLAPLTMETQQILLPLPCWVHLDDTDWKTVGGSSKHSRGQSVVIFIQKLCKENGEKHLDLHQLFFLNCFWKALWKNLWSHL